MGPFCSSCGHRTLLPDAIGRVKPRQRRDQSPQVVRAEGGPPYSIFLFSLPDTAAAAGISFRCLSRPLVSSFFARNHPSHQLLRPPAMIPACVPVATDPVPFIQYAATVVLPLPRHSICTVSPRCDACFDPSPTAFHSNIAARPVFLPPHLPFAWAVVWSLPLCAFRPCPFVLIDVVAVILDAAP